jgi:hypothetical protein
MRFIFNTGLSSQFMMDTIQSGQLVEDGSNKLTGQSVEDWLPAGLAGWSEMD